MASIESMEPNSRPVPKGLTTGDDAVDGVGLGDELEGVGDVEKPLMVELELRVPKTN